jgi:hypothetical protein
MTNQSSMDDCGLTFDELDSLARIYGQQLALANSSEGSTYKMRALISLIVQAADRLRSQRQAKGAPN